MKNCAELYLTIGLLFILFFKQPFITNFANTVLGKLSLVVFIYYITHTYGIRSGVISVIISIILMHNVLEGIDDTLESPDSPKENENDVEENTDENDDEEDTDDEDDDKHTKSDQLDIESTLKSDLVKKHDEQTQVDEPVPAPVSGKNQEGFSLIY